MSWGTKGSKGNSKNGGKGGGPYWDGWFYGEKAHGYPHQNQRVLKELRSLKSWLGGKGGGPQQRDSPTQQQPTQGGWDCHECGTSHHNPKLLRCRKCKCTRTKPREPKPAPTPVPPGQTWATALLQKPTGTSTENPFQSRLLEDPRFGAKLRKVGVPQVSPETPQPDQEQMALDTPSPTMHQQNLKDMQLLQQQHEQAVTSFGEDHRIAQLLKKELEDLRTKTNQVGWCKDAVTLSQAKLEIEREKLQNQTKMDQMQKEYADWKTKMEEQIKQQEELLNKAKEQHAASLKLHEEQLSHIAQQQAEIQPSPNQTQTSEQAPGPVINPEMVPQIQQQLLLAQSSSDPTQANHILVGLISEVMKAIGAKGMPQVPPNPAQTPPAAIIQHPQTAPPDSDL